VAQCFDKLPLNPHSLPYPHKKKKTFHTSLKIEISLPNHNDIEIGSLEKKCKVKRSTIFNLKSTFKA
jgi:hypothetical protein